MSNKFKNVLKKSHKTYLREKNKFLDTLADFINSTPYLIRDGDHFNFHLRCIPRGGNIDGTTIYGFSFFAITSKSKDNYSEILVSHDDVTIKLSEKAIFKMLGSKYHAEILPTSSNLIYEVNLPFVV